MKKLLFAIFAFIFLVSFKSDETLSPKDYLGIGNKLTFNNQDFNLAWSSNPMSGYYKQEYLLDSSTVENYNEMILIEAIEGKISPQLAVDLKVSELKKMKEENPVINWNVYQDKDEFIIDFILTDKATVYEWNLYRYTTVKDSKKQKYLLLRAYSFKDNLFTNDDLKPFFNRIVENRNDFIAKLSKFELPQLNVSKN